MINHLQKSNEVVWQLLLILLAAFPLFPLRITGMLILAWGISSLFFFTRYRKFSKYRSLMLFAFIIPYVALLVSILWSTDSLQSEFSLVQKISMWAFPLGFLASSSKLSRDTAILAALVFSGASLLLSTYGNLMVLLNGFITVDAGYAASDWSARYRLTIESYTLLHPTYQSLFLLFGMATVLHLLMTEKPKSNAILGLGVFTLVLLLGQLLLLGARFPVIAGALVGAFYFFKSAISRFNKIALSSFLVIIISITVFISPSLRQRFTEINPNNFTSAPIGNEHNSTNIRVGILQCAITLIRDNFFLGVGVGDIQTELNNCYTRYETPIYKSKDYNTHNSYLNFWISGGIIAFIGLIGLYVLLLFLFRNDQFFQSIILLIALCSLTENLLDRQMGVVFIFFFASLFAFTTIKENFT